MSRPSRRGRLVAAGAVALVAAGVLSGCGVSDQQIRPGVAAQVGDREVSIDELDESLDGACAYFASQAEERRAQDPTVGETARPRSDLRSQLLVLLMYRAVAEQVLDETGADLSADYQASVASLPDQRPGATGSQLAAILQGDEAAVFADSAKVGVGTELLEDEGVDQPTADDARARGDRAFTEWVAAHDIDVNPMFGVRVEDGAIAIGTVDDTSVAVSAFSFGASRAEDVLATGGEGLDPAVAQDAVSTYVGSLPDFQTCG